MRIEPALFLFVLVPATISQNCEAFHSSWTNICPSQQPLGILCYQSNHTEQSIIIRNADVIVGCGYQAPYKNILQCLPIKHVSNLIVYNCQFSNTSFKEFTGEKEPSSLLIEYRNGRKVKLDLMFDNLVKLSNISIRNVSADETFPAIFRKQTNLLNTLVIEHHTFKIFEKPFSNLTMLWTLVIRHGPLEVLKQETIHGLSRSLIWLDLSWNRIKEIEDMTFEKFSYLKQLLLTGNRIMKLTAGTFLGLSSTVTLRLDMNKITSISNKTFSAFHNLRSLNISYNPLTALPQKEPFGQSPQLNVSAQHCSLKKFPSINWESIRKIKLDLSHNRITHPLLLTCPNSMVRAYLHNNNISTISLNKTCGNSFQYPPQYFLADNTPDCNCASIPFLQFLQDEPRDSSHVFPDSDQLVCRKQNISLLKASTFCPRTDCPSYCSCADVAIHCENKRLTEPPFSVPEKATIAMLHRNKITSLKKADPQYWNHVEFINASYNLLTSLNDWSIPQKLKTLDVRYNHLHDLPLSLMSKVEDAKYVAIYLSENEWECNCKLVPFKEWFMENSFKVRDFEETLCNLRISGKGVIKSLIKDAFVDDFCIAMRIDSRIVIVMLPIFLVAVAVYGFYYKSTIFAVLYSWNVLRCSYFNNQVLWKKYDAFVCANVANRAIVVEIMKMLEPLHKLCIPERDWPKDGKFGTSTHLAHSLKNSRATLLVLSEDSLEETWFQVMVRGAYNQRLEDDVHKLILISVGDITGVPTKHDIREIINSERNLEWGERWFWQKLRYDLRCPNRADSD